MGLINVPLAKLRSFVVIQTEMNADKHVAGFHRIGETEIGWSIVDRIAAEDDEQIDFAAPHVGDEIFD